MNHLLAKRVDDLGIVACVLYIVSRVLLSQSDCPGLARCAPLGSARVSGQWANHFFMYRSTGV